MILRLAIERVRTTDAVRDFVAGSEPVDSHFTDRERGGLQDRDMDAETAVALPRFGGQFKAVATSTEVNDGR